MSKIPRQMRRQLEEAAAIEQQMFAPPAETPNEPAPVEPEAPVAMEPAAPVSEDPKWEQRFRTLRGQFNSLVPQLQSQVKDLKTELETRLSKPAPAPEQVERLTTEKDTEEFGADMLDVVARRAREVCREENRALVARIEELEAKLNDATGVLGKVSEHQVLTAQERFAQDLKAQIPDWETINEEPGFLAWLDLEDELSGRQRLELLREAGEALNLRRVAAIFKQYLATKQAPAPVQQPADTLQAQVAPARAAATPVPSAPPQAAIWKAADWQRSYEGLRRMPAGPDKTALEAELNSAMAQGRIQP